MEEGTIGLDDPVSRFIAPFAKTSDAVRNQAGTTHVPARRQIAFDWEAMRKMVSVVMRRSAETPGAEVPCGACVNTCAPTVAIPQATMPAATTACQ